MKWIYLLIAGALEVTWAVAMKMSNGFTVLIPSIVEYSCAVKPHVRSDGNRQSGAWEPPVRDLLAQCFI